MRLDLSDEETASLTQELHDIVENDRYPFSPRIRLRFWPKILLSAGPDHDRPRVSNGREA